MSCERDSNKVAARAAKSSGLSPGQSKFSRISGTMLGVRRGLGRSATAALAVMESFDAPKSIDSLGVLVPLAAFQGDRTRRQQVLQWLGLARVGQTAGDFAGTGLGRLSRIKKSGLAEGIEQRFFFKKNMPVGMWQSRLTPWLNTRDVLGAGQALASSGVMFEIEGQTWHRGTTTVKTPAGERTITHLQSLSLPASHYYFNRPLSDNEAVGIAAGQKGFEPKYMAGYAGQITAVESLSPAWAGLKRGLIRAHLFWGQEDNKK